MSWKPPGEENAAQLCYLLWWGSQVVSRETDINKLLIAPERSNLFGLTDSDPMQLLPPRPPSALLSSLLPPFPLLSFLLPCPSPLLPSFLPSPPAIRPWEPSWKCHLHMGHKYSSTIPSLHWFPASNFTSIRTEWQVLFTRSYNLCSFAIVPPTLKKKKSPD